MMPPAGAKAFDHSCLDVYSQGAAGARAISTFLGSRAVNHQDRVVLCFHQPLAAWGAEARQTVAIHDLRLADATDSLIRVSRRVVQPHFHQTNKATSVSLAPRATRQAIPNASGRPSQPVRQVCDPMVTAECQCLNTQTCQGRRRA